MPVVVADTRASLLTLQGDLARDQRFTVNGRFAVLTAATLDLDDRLVTHRDLIDDRLDRVDQRLGHLESDMVDVKSDVAGVKADLAGVKTDLAGVKSDVAEVLVLAERLPRIDAQLERLGELFERQEREGRPKE